VRRRRQSAGLVLTLVMALSLWAAAAADARIARATAKVATAAGRGGGAATVDRLATKAAIRILRRGGNAADAAVGAAAVLGVTEPFSSGIGGGGFMLIRKPSGGVSTIDGREEAPEAMAPDSFFEDGEPLDLDAARYSGLSVGVPGTVATWDLALRRFGTISLGKALAPGIAIARHGFKVDKTLYDQILENLEYFDDVPSTAGLYLDGDRTPRDIGAVIRNVDLAKAYALIGRLGLEGFYEGPIAEAIASAAQDPPVFDDADHTWRSGLITTDDIAAYEAVRRPPTRIGYRGLDVWGMGPPSSGGSTVGEALNILEGYSLPERDERAEAFHHMLEAERYAFADRSAYLADPDFFDVPLSGLLSNSFAAERRARITEEAADSGPVDPGDPYGNADGGTLASRRDHEGVSTTHVTVSDRRGMVVSYTFTIEGTGGSGIVVPDWGFLLNNELTDFDYDDPEAPNAPAGGKRPRSSMAPTIVTRGPRPLLAVGAAGGSTIITTVLQILAERLDLGMTLPTALAAPRASQRNRELTTAEPEFIDSPLGRALAARYGHDFEEPTTDPPHQIGAATGIEFLRKGRLRAAAEPSRRGGGYAMVVRPGARKGR
jgi:gamma-glutamyltranspeptidase/glutathione hydrolase